MMSSAAQEDLVQVGYEGAVAEVRLNRPPSRPLGLALEFEAVKASGATEDAKAGVMAFLEERKPVFKGT